MGLAKYYGGQSQQKRPFKKGGLVEAREPAAEERRESKMTPLARAKAEKAELKCGGKAKK